VTIVDDRPTTESERAPSPSLGHSWAPTASWRLAARLARREVRRRPGRTLLVALLVAIPICAMAIGSIITRSDTDRAAYARSNGASDFSITQYSLLDDAGELQEPLTIADLPAGTLPVGTASTDVLSVYTSVTTANGSRIDVTATHLDSASPIVDGIIDVTEGRVPTDGTDEVLLHPELADQFGVDVGDRLELARPADALTVVGLGRTSDDHRRPLMLLGDLERDQLRAWQLLTLVDLPPGSSASAALDSIARSGAFAPDQLQVLSARTPDGYWYAEGSYTTGDAQAARLAWGWVAGVLSLAALGVIIAAAFATSARRQLATVGQLAANGASPRLIRRTLSLQGTWSGAVGAAGGIVLALSMFMWGTPVLERIANRSWNGSTVAPVDIAVLFVTGVAAATIAALLPARSLANTSVLSALAGRRPIRPVQSRTVTAGVICFVSGLFLLAVAAAAAQGSVGGGETDLFAAVAVLGGVGVLAGMCLASPLAITGATAAASKLGASWRLSGRSLYRTRWRSAAVVTAIGVAGAFAVAGASVASNLESTSESPTDLPRDVVVVTTNNNSDVSTVDAAVLNDVRDVIGPSTESMVYGLDLAPPTDARLEAVYAEQSAPNADPALGSNLITPSEIVVADDDLIDGMGLSASDRAALDEVGAMAVWATFVSDDPGAPIRSPIESPVFRTRLVAGDGDFQFDAVGLQNPYTSRNGVNSYLMTEEYAAELGIGVIPAGIRFTAGDDLTSSQRRALDQIRFGDTDFSDVWIVGDEAAAFPSEQTRGRFWINYQYVTWTPSATLVQGAIVGATLLLVLLVVAIGLSLAAVESRDERNTLIAIGASPSTLRRRSATTATVLAATGGVLAVPTGLLPVWVVTWVNDDTASVPWLSIAAIVVIVPLLVGAVALIGSAIVQQLHPPKALRDFTD
jgi:putative ABC transport system permease protein